MILCKLCAVGGGGVCVSYSYFEVVHIYIYVCVCVCVCRHTDKKSRCGPYKNR